MKVQLLWNIILSATFVSFTLPESKAAEWLKQGKNQNFTHLSVAELVTNFISFEMLGVGTSEVPPEGMPSACMPIRSARDDLRVSKRVSQPALHSCTDT